MTKREDDLQKDVLIPIRFPFTLDKTWCEFDESKPPGFFTELRNYIPARLTLRAREGILAFTHTPQDTSVPITSNDFSGDANCISWYKMDSYTGNTVTDEISGNNVTGSSTGNSAYITVDTTNKIAPGVAASLALDNLPTANSALLTISYANQVVKFPGNAGVATTMSVLGWFRQTGTLGTFAQGAVGMWEPTSSARSWLLYAFSTSNTWRMLVREVGGTNGVDITTSITLAAGAWYHVKGTYDSATLTGTLRICDSSGVSLFSSSDTMPADMKVQNNSMYIGTFNADPTRGWDGNVQEVCIFNDVVTNAEQDQIIAGTYSP